MHFDKYFLNRFGRAVFTGAVLAASAVGGGDDASGPSALPATYAFTNAAGESTVAYGGQTFRHVLIQEMDGFTGALSGLIDGDAETPYATAGRSQAELDSWFRFDETAAERRFEYVTFGLQDSFDDLASPRGLVGKTAGEDASTDHRDWDGGAFLGWRDTALLGAEAGTSPVAFVDTLTAALDAQAVARAGGGQLPGPSGEALPVYVTAEGLDLQQLLEKFLLMSVAFSQGVDDYLDDDVDGKGLLAPNTLAEGTTYTVLAHQWDEGFGYFGAPRDYADYSDEELAGAGGRADWQGQHDTNGDGAIDLESEFVWGAASNAAKRDLGSASGTDFTGEAWDGFLRGRALITGAGETLTDNELAQLQDARDQAVAGWEGALAATVVHYINDTLADMDAFGTEGYDFVTHAKHWAEMKGFALGLQFNPRSPLLDGFEAFHDLIGDRPVLSGAGEEAIAAYREALLAARAQLGTAYGFAAADLSAW
ncbi:MAG: DUF4856 domain-containing protein [Myxococcota bacterium]